MNHAITWTQALWKINYFSVSPKLLLGGSFGQNVDLFGKIVDLFYKTVDLLNEIEDIFSKIMAF